jgi:hypothetical protein
MIELNDEVLREAKKSLKEKGIKAEDVKNCNDPGFYQILGENFCFYFACIDRKFTRI